MICCVEDDESIRNIMVYTLNVSALPAIGVKDGKDLTKVLQSTVPELIILDIMLPGEDGIAVWMIVAICVASALVLGGLTTTLLILKRKNIIFKGSVKK